MNEMHVIGDRLRTQDNRITQDPMFCVQILRRDVGYDSKWMDNHCWRDSANEETIYADDKDFNDERRTLVEASDEWYEFGYVDRWETVMVSFTEIGCLEYLRLNGHNERDRAFRGQIRIYVESYYRCTEMIAVREFLLKQFGKAKLEMPEEAISNLESKT